MQQNIKLRNKSQHHITLLKLLFWVWKPPKKPKMGKPMQQSDIDFIMRKYGTFRITAIIHPNFSNAVPDRINGKILAKPQHPPM